jgi:cell division control protein 6
MGLFDDTKKRNIFLNPIVLDYDYQPKLILYRDQQQHFIANCIKPLMSNRSGRNLFIYGKPGIGKTVACRHVLKELEEDTEILPIYINCWKKNTSHKVILEICDYLDYKFTANKSTEELIAGISSLLNKNPCVICLDEVDKLDNYDVIYTLLEDIFKKSIILITNHKEWLIKLDSRIKSRLNPESLEFKQYNYEETLGILKERISYAFHSGIFGMKALEIIAKKAFELGDMRTGVYLLKECGDLAELNGKDRIEIDEANQAINKINNFSTKKDDDLKDDLSEILKMIKLNENKSSSELFDVYGKGSYKTFKRKLDELEKNKFISMKEVNSGANGRKYIVSSGGLKTLSEF